MASETYSSKFSYCVFTQGQDVILSSYAEWRCQYPKVRLPNGDRVAASLVRALETYPPSELHDSGSHAALYAYHFQQIASDDLLVDKYVCGFHLARALSALILELNSGFIGDVYDEFSRSLHALVEDWTWPRPEVAELAHSCLSVLLSASTSGGSPAFINALNSLDDELFPSRGPRGRWERARRRTFEKACPSCGAGPGVPCHNGYETPLPMLMKEGNRYSYNAHASRRAA